MANVRLIARLDIKGPNLIKGIRLEGLRVVGDPREFATRHYLAGADEILYMDAVASLYERNSLSELIKWTAAHVFIPMTVGGGLRSVEDVRDVLRCGADKVCINTAAVKRPELIREVAQRFGSQCMVLQVDAKRTRQGGWEAYTDGGREHSGLDVVAWVKKAEELGAGEILLTSVDQEGTRQGFDLPLIKAVSTAVHIPVIASGGMGTPEHLLQAVQEGKADAVAMADILHYSRKGLDEIRAAAAAAGIPVRHPYPEAAAP
ncbi:MAG: imidazole glycerol phosphate synthase cyclase subunit [Thermodesulfobacteriota bacterium]